MNFAAEGYSPTLLEEMAPLWQAHYDEVAFHKDIPFVPDLDRYAQMNERGILRIFTAREEGDLVGYAVFLVLHHPHFKTSLQALADILFVCPSMRKGTSGFRFIGWCDEQLRASGVQLIVHNVTVRRDFSLLLERLGYRKQEIVYSRRIA